jgi:hypothetical protein
MYSCTKKEKRDMLKAITGVGGGEIKENNGGN